MKSLTSTAGEILVGRDPLAPQHHMEPEQVQQRRRGERVEDARDDGEGLLGGVALRPVLGQEVDGGRHAEDDAHEQRDHVHVEEEVVLLPDAVVEPLAVVVELECAAVAHLAVLRRAVHPPLARAAEHVVVAGLRVAVVRRVRRARRDAEGEGDGAEEAERDVHRRVLVAVLRRVVVVDGARRRHEGQHEHDDRHGPRGDLQHVERAVEAVRPRRLRAPRVVVHRYVAVDARDRVVVAFLGSRRPSSVRRLPLHRRRRRRYRGTAALRAALPPRLFRRRRRGLRRRRVATYGGHLQALLAASMVPRRAWRIVVQRRRRSERRAAIGRRDVGELIVVGRGVRPRVVLRALTRGRR
mmetsp:Transcript_5952/g.18796  ORF Transcript_5952/g.18796 Transcript_5952/m.18796 type:complete len:354 (-) Transcript_5952:353-1414(-)